MGSSEVEANYRKRLIIRSLIQWPLLILLSIPTWFMTLIILAIPMGAFGKIDKDSEDLIVMIPVALYGCLVMFIANVSSFAFPNWILSKWGLALYLPNESTQRIFLRKKRHDALIIRIKGIKEELENPGDIRLNRFSNLINDALSAINECNEALAKYSQTIDDLQHRVEIEKQKADEARKIIATVKGLTEEELNSVKNIITKDAACTSRRYFCYGMIVAIPTAILSATIYDNLKYRADELIKFLLSLLL